MTNQIERNRNTYDLINAPEGIQLNSSTYTKVLDADPRRIGYKSTNDSNSDFLILEKAPVDQLDRGFIQFKRTLYESVVDTPPVGEVFMKAKNGNPTVLVVSY